MISSKLYGTTGKILRVDLGNEQTWEEQLGESTLVKYVGGTALGAKYLYDLVDPKVDWSNPQNIIYVGAGPLGGTRMAGAGCFSIVTKGALNNGVASTQANGFFGAFLKFSGFDGILIQGAAHDWKYLYIHDGTAELRDAKHLVGQDTWQIEDSIKKELGYNDRTMSVFGIGPAGENLVKFAGVLGDKGHSASHNGVGAVWGSKKLKAVAVSRSTGKIAVAQPNRLSNIVKRLNEDLKGHPIYKWGTSLGFGGLLPIGGLPIRNYTTNIFPEWERFDGTNVRSRFKVKNHPCWACPTHHCELMTVTEGLYAGYSGEEPEYEQWAAWGPVIGQTDPGAAVMLSNEVDKLGLDCNEGGWIVGWVMECYEKGLLTSKDLDGIEMTWGNAEATLALMKNIAYRRGFGAVLAEGIKYAAEHVGGEALNLAVYTMQTNTPRTHDHRGRWDELLSTCITNTGTVETLLPQIPDLSVYGVTRPKDRFSGKEVSTVDAKTKGSTQFLDSLVVCSFATRHNLPVLAEALSAATGWDFSFAEALKVGRRAVTLMRVFNIKAGFSPELEKPSLRYGSTPVDGPNKGISIQPQWEDMLDNYYRLMGWNRKTGLPLPETLSELELEYLLED